MSLIMNKFNLQLHFGDVNRKKGSGEYGAFVLRKDDEDNYCISQVSIVLCGGCLPK